MDLIKHESEHKKTNRFNNDTGHSIGDKGRLNRNE